MDFQKINQIMATRSLVTDPAFDAMRVEIEPIPCSGGICPIGLYDPDTAIITLPPNGLEATLLHELGHRHGHYYYNDLSEAYAEYFRKIYQPKGRAMLYMGNDIDRLPRLGSIFEEGERGAVEVALFHPLTPNELHMIKTQLNSYSEPPPRCCYGNGEGVPFLRFEFTKGIDWMVIIAAALAGLVAVTTVIMGYAIYKVSEEHPWMAPVAIFGIIAAIALGLGLGVKYAPQLRESWSRVTA